MPQINKKDTQLIIVKLSNKNNCHRKKTKQDTHCHPELAG